MARQRFLLLILLIYTAASAQMRGLPVSATYTRLTAYSHQFGDAFSFGSNLGALGTPQQLSAGVYTERRFMLKELASFNGAVVVPTGSGNFGWRGDYFGSAAYNQSSTGLAYARELGSKVALGVQFNYYALTTAGYGRASTIGFDAGILLKVSSQVNAGLQVSNPLGASWGKEGVERIPALYAAGLGYDVSKQVFIGLEVEKQEDKPVSVNAGLHYAVAEKLVARTGVHSAAQLYYLGVGVVLKHFRVDVTASVHPYLGTTPGMLLLYSAKE
ncbi:MAG: hypothetical protein M3Q06_00435 [Bacteroidota bacterium]|nr:hypothetical protein [Bacteroidota bacterium]